MRTAVDRVGTGKMRQVNARFAAMASHYLFEPTFCSPASGWEKGQVEKNVQDARRQIWQDMPSFSDLPSLNAWLEARCVERWGEIAHGVLPGSVADVHAQERGSLMPLGRAFDGFVEHTKRVSPTCLVHFETSRYSVPASFANRPVSLRVYPDRLVVVAEGQVVCEHARVVERAHDVPRRTVYDWRHYLAVIQRKPGALRNGMAQAVGELAEQGAPAFEAAVPILSQLLKAEMAEREVRSIAYHTKAARFPAYKDLASFDFAASEVNEATIRQLHQGEYTNRADNVVLIGGPGTGKTHVATALGVQAIEHGRKKVRFYSTVDLVNLLEQEKTANKAGHLAESLLRLDLVILDELGYLPFSSSGGALLFTC